MPMKSAFAGLLLSAVAVYGAADPQLMGLMMPDAKVVAGFQLKESQSTPFGQFLLKQIPANAGLENFVVATGFDPRQDLNAIVAGSAGDNRWLIAGRGAFQATRVAGLAELAGAVVTQYKGTDLITGNPNNGNPANSTNPNRGRRRPNAGGTTPVNAVGFLDSSTVLIGDLELIKSAIDRRTAGSAFNGPLALKAREVSGQNQAWAATLSPVQDLVPALNGTPVGAGPVANLLQAITGLSVGLQMGVDNVTVNGEAATRSNQDAQALVDILHFLTTMAQANRQDPQSGGMAALADAALITANGASVKLTLKVSEQQLEQLFPSQAGVKKISLPAR